MTPFINTEPMILIPVFIVILSQVPADMYGAEAAPLTLVKIQPIGMLLMTMAKDIR
jgi:hypothetical protein